MVVPLCEEEIRRVVLESNGAKSPGPDGFNFSFYKRFWDLLKGEVGTMFNQFFHSATLPDLFLRSLSLSSPRSPHHSYRGLSPHFSSWVSL